MRSKHDAGYRNRVRMAIRLRRWSQVLVSDVVMRASLSNTLTPEALKEVVCVLIERANRLRADLGVE